MVARESQLKNFFGSVAAIAREYKVGGFMTRWGSDETDLNNAILDTQKKASPPSRS